MGFVNHFNKYNKWYSFGLLLIVTILVALLFLRIEQLDTFVSEQLNTPSVQHAKTVQDLEKKKEAESMMEDNSMMEDDGTMMEDNSMME